MGTERPDPLTAGDSGGPPRHDATASRPEPDVALTDAAADSPAPAPESSEAAASPDHDPTRRAFFLQFGKQAVSTVGQVAGMADIVSRTSGSAAASLLGLGDEPAKREAQPVLRSGARSAAAVTAATGPPLADEAFRSPYRLVGDELVLLDQRGIPETLEEVVAKRGSDVAYYLRLGVTRGGPVMAQVAAYGLALTARERAALPLESIDVELRRTERALAAARPSSRLPIWAMERMAAARSGLGDTIDGTATAEALRAEADAIATGLQAHQASIAAGLVELLSAPLDRPLAVLVHGNPGALSGGLVGPGIAALRRLVEQDRPLRVFVTETRPFMDGARLASWELRQTGIEHKIIADAAVAWLFAREPIDVVIAEAEWIAADGDCAAVIGSRAVAQQAAAVPPETRPRVIVLGVTATIDRATVDGAAIPTELRPARDLAAYLADVPIRAADAVVPATDVIPAQAIAALVTERGVLTDVHGETIAAILDAARAGST